MTDEIASAVSGEGHGFPLGYTYNGHPTGAAVALANLDIVEREAPPDRAKNLGEVLRDQLETLRDIPVVGDVRGVGLMAAVEVVVDRQTRKPHPDVDAASARMRSELGVIVRPGVGSNLILSPPLVITENQLARCVDAIRVVLSDLAATTPGS